MGIGDWGLGIGDWGLAQSPIPNPQSPIPNPQWIDLKVTYMKFYLFIYLVINKLILAQPYLIIIFQF